MKYFFSIFSLSSIIIFFISCSSEKEIERTPLTPSEDLILQGCRIKAIAGDDCRLSYSKYQRG